VRQEIRRDLPWSGTTVEEARLSAYVIPAHEERVIARETIAVRLGRSGQGISVPPLHPDHSRAERLEGLPRELVERTARPCSGTAPAG
jgi:hypothetical protein